MKVRKWGKALLHVAAVCVSLAVLIVVLGFPIPLPLTKEQAAEISRKVPAPAQGIAVFRAPLWDLGMKNPVLAFYEVVTVRYDPIDQTKVVERWFLSIFWFDLRRALTEREQAEPEDESLGEHHNRA